MGQFYLPFEKPIAELEAKLKELEEFSAKQKVDVSGEVDRIRQRIVDTRRSIFSSLTPWQRVLVARHPQRPYTRDYLQLMASEFIELQGTGEEASFTETQLAELLTLGKAGVRQLLEAQEAALAKA